MNTKMKRIILICMAALLIVGSFCFLEPAIFAKGKVVHLNTKYAIVQNGSECYLRFGLLSSKYRTPDENFSQMGPQVVFSSLKEMKADIQNGTFTEEELRNISQFPRSENGYPQTVNIAKLYEPVIPSTICPRDVQITWIGNSYSFWYGRKVTACYYPKDFFDSEVDRRYFSLVDTIREHGAKNIITETSENATVVNYETSLGWKAREKLYTIADDSKVLYVIESYWPERESDTIPESVTVYGSQNGQYFFIYFASPTRRYSMDELSAIGVREYVETEVS